MTTIIMTNDANGNININNIDSFLENILTNYINNNTTVRKIYTT